MKNKSLELSTKVEGFILNASFTWRTRGHLSSAGGRLEIPALWAEAWGTEMVETAECIRKAQESAQILAGCRPDRIFIVKRWQRESISTRKHYKSIVNQVHGCIKEAHRLVSVAEGPLELEAKWTRNGGHPRIAERILKVRRVVLVLKRDIECIAERIQETHPLTERIWRGRGWGERLGEPMSLGPPRPYNPNQNTWRRRFRRK